MFEATCKSRNKEQVRNVLKSVRGINKLTHDEQYNFYLIAAHLGDYVRYIQTWLDLNVILFYTKLVENLRECLLLPDCIHGGFALQYDITFNIGNFYVSCLTFRCIIFEISPTISLGFLTYEQKFRKDDKYFMKLFAELCPTLSKKIVPLVTDNREFKHLKDVLPKCMHHILHADLPLL